MNKALELVQELIQLKNAPGKHDQKTHAPNISAKDALEWYVVSGTNLNTQLRAGIEPIELEAKKVIQLLENAPILGKETRLYRGLEYQQEVPDVDLGIVSTSKNDKIAEQFVGSSVHSGNVTLHGTMLIMDVDPNVRALNIGGPQEEVLLQPRVRFVETMRSEGVIPKGYGFGSKINYIWLNVLPPNNDEKS